MSKEKEKLEFRYYEIPEHEMILALLGNEWIRYYGEGIHYLHFHNLTEIGICYWGRGEIVLGDRHYPFREGNVIIVPPNYPHTTNAKKGTKAYWEWMYIDSHAVFSEIYSKDPIKVEHLLKIFYEKPYLLSDEEDFKEVTMFIKKITQECLNKGYMYRENIKALLQSMVIELLRLRLTKEENSRTKKYTLQISPAMDYVEKHCCEGIRIGDLAEVCHMSESHFRRIFYESMNMKPLDYVNFVRIQHACDILVKKDYSMTEIAYRTGFCNVSTFTRNFKKILGITPYQWRKSSENYEAKLLNYHISAQKGW